MAAKVHVGNDRKTINKNQMKGGARPNSGRKPGVSKATELKRKIQEYFSEDEVQNLIQEAKEQAKTKPELMKFLLEQIFGKAPQQVELTGKDGEPIVIKWQK
jgi:hypothetical protein